MYQLVWAIENLPVLSLSYQPLMVKRCWDYLTVMVILTDLDLRLYKTTLKCKSGVHQLTLLTSCLEVLQHQPVELSIQPYDGKKLVTCSFFGCNDYMSSQHNLLCIFFLCCCQVWHKNIRNRAAIDCQHIFLSPCLFFMYISNTNWIWCQMPQLVWHIYILKLARSLTQFLYIQ